MSLNHANDNVESERLSLMWQCNFNEGMKTFGEKGKEAALKELRQQHACECFAPIAVVALSEQEWKRAQQALMHLAEKEETVALKDAWCAMVNWQENV